MHCFAQKCYLYYLECCCVMQNYCVQHVIINFVFKFTFMF
jgi:hypothetical protein